nr:SusC/RagA family TonB-linked outer membrane protein [uncultured Carboxylicivirga sp.]
MRISVFILFVCLLNLKANPGYSQNTLLNFKVKNANIETLFKTIEQQTEFKFFYQDEQIQEYNKEINIIVKDKTVDDVLSQVLNNTELTYKVVDKHIIIFERDENNSNQNQEVTLKGKVTSADTGEPIPGVNVVIKGTTNGTITDIDGKYTLTATKGQTLVFMFVGMKNHEVIIGDASTINVALESEVIGLDEVVAIGYGTIKTADVTSSVSSVKSEDFNVGSVQDAGQLIQGKVAGLTLNTTSGDPTGNTTIRLRGNTTLNGTSTAPLVLVDGVPSDFNTVAPEDIESIDVLKDGSAAAIYGTRGTNGVIIITTKRASGNYGSQVEYAGYVSTQAISNKLDMLTADDYRRLNEDGTANLTDNGYSTDWLDEITRTPINHVHNLTLRGGNAQTNYLATINYRDMNGFFMDNYHERFTGRADVNHTMFDGLLKLNIGVLGRTSKQRAFDGYTYRQAIIYNPTDRVKDDEGNWTEYPGAFNYDNPVSRIKESDALTSNNLTRITGSATLNPLDGLYLKANFSYSKWNDIYGYYETSKHINTVRNSVNGYAYNNTTENKERLLELTGEYKKAFGDHNFTALGGYSFQDFDGRFFEANNSDFATDNFGYNNMGLGYALTDDNNPRYGMDSRRTKTNLISFFGRLNYNYKNRYLLMVSVRHEAASQLYGTEDPWGTFPAVSVGWRLTEEPFMANVDFLNDLKLRAGYGVTGTQPNSIYLGMAALRYDTPFYYNGQWIQALSPSRNPNPYLRWEEKKETNVGVDYAMLSNRLTGSIDYYNREIDGLLYDYGVAQPPNQVSTTRANAGNMVNSGLEILINAAVIQKTDFEWNTTVTFSTNKNKLKSLSNDTWQSETDYITAGGTGEPIQTFTHLNRLGGPIGDFYGFKVVDVDSDGKWVYEDPEGNTFGYDEFGRRFEDKQVLGNGLPKFYAGWNNNFRYKKWDLSVTMRGAFDYQILNFERMYLENTQVAAQYNRLKSAYEPVFGKEVLSTDVALEYNSYYIEDGDHWKIDNITLGYTFDTSNLKYISRVRVYASTLNTFVITGYKGIDPEVTSSGLAPGNDYRDKYPTARTFTFGVNVSF